MSPEQRGSIALTRIGAMVIGVEGHRVTGFYRPGEREIDCDLARLLAVPIPPGSAARLLELEHARGRLVIAVHGRVRMAPSDQKHRCERPPLVAGVFRRACLRGVMRHESELVYLLDVDQLAARLAQEEGTP